MKVHLIYFSLQLKRLLQFFPRLIVGTVVLVILTGAIASYGTNVLYGKSAAGKITIGIVQDDDSSLMELAMTYLESSESVNSFCTLITLPEKEAQHRLQDKSVAAYIRFPKSFARDVVTGRNTPAVIYLSEDSGVEQLFFQELMTAASRILNYAQASVYSLGDIWEEYDLAGEKSTHLDYINRNTMESALVRSELFQIVTVSSTGTLSVSEFYIVSGIVLLFFLMGMSIGRFAVPENAGLSRMLTLKGLSLKARTVWKLAAMVCFYLLTGALVFLAGCVSGLLPWRICAALPVLSVMAAAQTLFLYSLASGETTGTLLVFLYTLLSAFCCGCLLPAAFLPQEFGVVGKLFPVNAIRTFLASVYLDTFSWKELPEMLLFVSGFLILSCIGCRRAERRLYHEG